MNPAKSVYDVAAAISSRVSAGSNSSSVSSSTEPSKCRCSSARGVILAIIAFVPPPDEIQALAEGEIQAIVEGRHRDAFSVLGPHGMEIRAWLPGTKEASVILGDRAIPMTLVHPSGFFVAELPKAAGEYRLLTGAYEFNDPYRFPPLLTSFELYLHGEGTNHESYRTLGAHSVKSEGVDGVRFAVWAPNAEVVSVIGDFNRWDRTWHPMRLRDGGIWEIFIPGLTEGANYKYSVLSRTGEEQQKADPYAFFAEIPPKTASIVWSLSNYTWTDAEWMPSPRRPRVVPRTRFHLRSAS